MAPLELKSSSGKQKAPFNSEASAETGREAGMKTDLEKVKELAKDLRKGYPRSPREKLGGYEIAARCVDKCRAFLLGMNGEYNYWPCSLAGQWFSFTGITPEQLKDVVVTGATDK
jgi:hypothetical protein